MNESDTEKLELFKKAVGRFLNAVASKDWPVFMEFISLDKKFLAILPGDKTIDNTYDFLETQKPWFNGTTGTFNYKIEEAKRNSLNWIATIKAVYENIDDQGKSFSKNIEITMTFLLDGQQWILVENINRVQS